MEEILENSLWCLCWLWVCLFAEAVFVLYKNSHVHSLARYPWPPRAAQVLCGAVWLLGAIQAGNFLSGSVRLPCEAWSLWLVRVFGACGWTAAFCYSLFEKWSSEGGPPQLVAATFTFSAAMFFGMIVPYSIQAGYHPDLPSTASLPCFPTPFYEACAAAFQLAICLLAARCAARSNRHLILDATVARTSLWHDVRTRRLCVAAALLVPLLSVPANFQFGVDPRWSAAGAIGAACCAVLWSVADALLPAFRFASDDRAFSSGFASSVTYEEKCMYQMLEAISPDNQSHLALFIERCSEFNGKLDDAIDERGVHRPELLVRQFIRDRRLDVEFALFVAIMWRNDAEDLEVRRALTDSIISHFFVSQRLSLPDEAREIILSDAGGTGSDYFFDNLLRILNGRFDINRYKWKVQHDDLYNRPILIDGLTPEAAMAAHRRKPQPPSPGPDPSEAERQKTEREIEEFLMRSEAERRERNALYDSRKLSDYTIH